MQVAHEALIRAWPSLRQWLSEDREGLRLHRHLTEASLAWEKLGQDVGELYRGARLAQTLEWVAQGDHAKELNALEQEYLNAAQDFAECETLEREAQRQRELEAAQRMAETAQKLAEAEQRRALEHAHAAQRLRQRAWVLALTLATTLLLLVAVLWFAHRASLNAAAAEQERQNIWLQSQTAFATRNSAAECRPAAGLRLPPRRLRGQAPRCASAVV